MPSRIDGEDRKILESVEEELRKIAGFLRAKSLGLNGNQEYSQVGTAYIIDMQANLLKMVNDRSH